MYHFTSTSIGKRTEGVRGSWRVQKGKAQPSKNT